MECNYSFRNFNGVIVDVLGWICNFIPHVNGCNYLTLNCGAIAYLAYSATARKCGLSALKKKRRGIPLRLRHMRAVVCHFAAIQLFSEKQIQAKKPQSFALKVPFAWNITVNCGFQCRMHGHVMMSPCFYMLAGTHANITGVDRPFIFNNLTLFCLGLLLGAAAMQTNNNPDMLKAFYRRLALRIPKLSY